MYVIYFDYFYNALTIPQEMGLNGGDQINWFLCWGRKGEKNNIYTSILNH